MVFGQSTQRDGGSGRLTQISVEQKVQDQIGQNVLIQYAIGLYGVGRWEESWQEPSWVQYREFCPEQARTLGMRSGLDLHGVGRVHEGEDQMNSLCLTLAQDVHYLAVMRAWIWHTSGLQIVGGWGRSRLESGGWERSQLGCSDQAQDLYMGPICGDWTGYMEGRIRWTQWARFWHQICRSWMQEKFGQESEGPVQCFFFFLNNCIIFI